MNRLLKRILTVGAGLALSAMLAVPAFAATTPETPAHSADININKILTSNIANAFPITDSFAVELKPSAVIHGRDSGTAPTTADMPMPAGATENGADRVATLTVSDLDIVTGSDDKKKDNADTLANDKFTISYTGTKKVPVEGEADKDVTTYAEPGIYTYTLTEKVPGAGAELGLTYDPETYYVNVYVTNVVDATTNQPEITADGELMTTVSNITLYKGTNRTSNMLNEDNNGLAPGDTLAEGETNNKIGINGTTPNQITAPINNTFGAENLTVSKTVTGNLGDPNKEFEFIFTPATTGEGSAPTGYKYSYKVYTMAGAAPADTDTAVTAKAGTFDDKNNTVKLTHKQYVVVAGLPDGLKYTVAETKDDTYITNIAWQNGNDTVTADHGTLGSDTDSVVSTGERKIVTTTKTNGETGNRDNHAYFTNNKEATTPTGVLLRVAPFVLLAALLVAGIVLVVLNGKKRRDSYQGL